MSRFKTLKNFIPAILWMIIIFSFSCQVAVQSDMNNGFVIDVLSKFNIDLVSLIGKDLANFLIRKAAHITEYFILFMLVYRGCSKSKFKYSYVLSFFISVLYAGTDEFHQIFVQGRSGKLVDVAIDSIGISIALILVIIYRNYKKSRSTI